MRSQVHIYTSSWKGKRNRPEVGIEAVWCAGSGMLSNSTKPPSLIVNKCVRVCSDVKRHAGSRSGVFGGGYRG